MFVTQKKALYSRKIIYTFIFIILDLNFDFFIFLCFLFIVFLYSFHYQWKIFIFYEKYFFWKIEIFDLKFNFKFDLRMTNFDLKFSEIFVHSFFLNLFSTWFVIFDLNFNMFDSFSSKFWLKSWIFSLNLDLWFFAINFFSSISDF